MSRIGATLRQEVLEGARRLLALARALILFLIALAAIFCSVWGSTAIRQEWLNNELRSHILVGMSVEEVRQELDNRGIWYSYGAPWQFDGRSTLDPSRSLPSDSCTTRRASTSSSIMTATVGVSASSATPSQCRSLNPRLEVSPATVGFGSGS